MKLEDLKAENGDAARAAAIQREMQEILQEIAALQRTRAEKRKAVAEEWRAADARLAEQALARNTGAWKARGARWDTERRTSARQLAARVAAELKQALLPWSTREAAQLQLGEKLDDSVRMFLGSVDLHEYAERFESERHVSTPTLFDLRRPALTALGEKVGLSVVQIERLSGALHAGEDARDGIAEAFLAGVSPDDSGVVSGILDLSGKVKGSNTTKLVVSSRAICRCSPVMLWI